MTYRTNWALTRNPGAPAYSGPFPSRCPAWRGVWRAVPSKCERTLPDGAGEEDRHKSQLRRGTFHRCRPGDGADTAGWAGEWRMAQVLSATGTCYGGAGASQGGV